MSFDESGDTVLFAFLDPGEASALSLFLRSRRQEAWHDCDGIWIVVAEVKPVAGDLAILLRDVEDWLSRRDLRELRFSVDGCWYVLRAARVAAAASAA
jgi:hypothetical protein